MDTTAYLHSQGWLGAGHALAARGLSKPLLVSQKQNVLGVGKKRHDAHADQWWTRAFDGCLKGLEVSRVVEGKAKEKDGKKEEGDVRVEGRGGGLDALRSGRAGLYGFFVRGEGLRGTFVEGAVGAVNGEGAGGVEKGVDGKRSEGQGVEDRAERRRRRKERKERKERNIAEAVVVVQDEVPDVDTSKRLRKDERKKRRGRRDGAEDGAVLTTAIAEATQRVSSPSLPKKKRRRVESDGDISPELITSEDHGTTETSVSGSCEPKATDEADPKAMQRKGKSSVEKLERRRRRATRKALKAEQNHSAEGQAGQEGDGSNKTHRKKKREHSEKQVQALE